MLSTISSSATLFFFCLQSFLESGSFPRSWLFTSGRQKYQSLNVSPSNEYLGLTGCSSCKTLMSFPQHYNWKASVLWCSTFFMLLSLLTWVGGGLIFWYHILLSFSYCLWGSPGKNTGVVCHLLITWLIILCSRNSSCTHHVSIMHCSRGSSWNVHVATIYWSRD